MSKTSKASLALTLMTPLAAFILASCARNEAAEAPQAPPPVQAAKVVLKQITEFDEFTGRFEAVERVELRPRVSGYVTAARFQQGHEVKKGDILYVIDSRPYQATLKHAQAELTRARTQLALASSERRQPPLASVYGLPSIIPPPKSSGIEKMIQPSSGHSRNGSLASPIPVGAWKTRTCGAANPTSKSPVNSVSRPSASSR